ncbi:hypothetical protein [Aeromonas dhakensis]|uniref:hypothetical protein n=1 Tax=Aeromonas dhakensis TaxID=196024 RepID=UPI0005A75CE7|nr:hypothetical protein [Aeromonas dhakensis]
MKALILALALVATGTHAAEKPYDYHDMLRERAAARDAAMGLGYPTEAAADDYVIGLTNDAERLLPRYKIPKEGAEVVCNGAVNAVITREFLNLAKEHPEVDTKRTADFGMAYGLFAYHQCLYKGTL